MLYAAIWNIVQILANRWHCTVSTHNNAQTDVKLWFKSNFHFSSCLALERLKKKLYFEILMLGWIFMQNEVAVCHLLPKIWNISKIKVYKTFLLTPISYFCLFKLQNYWALKFECAICQSPCILRCILGKQIFV